jgi:ATP-dependent DNA ligase
MLPNLDVLQRKCQELGLTVAQKGKRPSKDDCVRVLRAHFLPDGGLPYEELTPMLCFPSWDIKPEEMERIWASSKWIAQEKLNGCRAMLHAVKGVGWFVHSRTISLKTYRFEELTSRTLLSEVEPPPFSGTFDTEVMIAKPIDTAGFTSGGKGALTKTSLHSTTAVLHLEAGAAKRLQKEQDAPLVFRVFDVMKANGADLRNKPLSYRLGLLESVREAFEKLPYAAWFDFPLWTGQNKKDFHEGVLAMGGEGTILKHVDSTYEDSSSRRRDGWLKVKKRREYDAYVTGFLRGDKDTAWKNLVGALEFSIMTEKGEHVIGYGTNLTMESRQKITLYDEANDKVTLHPGMYDKVAEISGQDISGRALRLSHCTIDRWRPKQGPDAKRKEDCVCNYSDLEEAAAWVS